MEQQQIVPRIRDGPQCWNPEIKSLIGAMAPDIREDGIRCATLIEHSPHRYPYENTYRMDGFYWMLPLKGGIWETYSNTFAIMALDVACNESSALVLIPHERLREELGKIKRFIGKNVVPPASNLQWCGKHKCVNLLDIDNRIDFAKCITAIIMRFIDVSRLDVSSLSELREEYMYTLQALELHFKRAVQDDEDFNIYYRYTWCDDDWNTLNQKYLSESEPTPVPDIRFSVNKDTLFYEKQPYLYRLDVYFKSEVISTLKSTKHLPIYIFSDRPIEEKK